MNNISELINNLEISNDEKESLKEIFTKASILFKNESKINKEEKTLLLFTISIKKSLEKKEPIKDKNIKFLKEHIAEYAEKIKKIDWNQYLPTSSSQSQAAEQNPVKNKEEEIPK